MLDQAARMTSDLPLVVFRGLPGTGKTHLVRRLVQTRSDLLVLSRDGLRAAVIADPTFAADEKALIDDMIVAMAGFLLGRGCGVVIDGMALSSALRVEELARTAESRGVPLFIVECVCSEATSLERIARDQGAHPAGDRGQRLYFEVKARWEQVARPVLLVDTEGDPAPALAAILGRIGGARGRDDGASPT